MLYGALGKFSNYQPDELVKALLNGPSIMTEDEYKKRQEISFTQYSPDDVAKLIRDGQAIMTKEEYQRNQSLSFTKYDPDVVNKLISHGQSIMTKDEYQKHQEISFTQYSPNDVVKTLLSSDLAQLEPKSFNFDPSKLKSSNTGDGELSNEIKQS